MHKHECWCEWLNSGNALPLADFQLYNDRHDEDIKHHAYLEGIPTESELSTWLGEQGYVFPQEKAKMLHKFLEAR